MKTVLVTGATGFVGRELCRTLLERGYRVRAAVRSTSAALSSGDIEAREIGDIATFSDWDSLVAGVDHVIHAAARVHVMNDVASDPLAEFRAVNTGPSAELATAAARAKVSRFVFLSTIKVLGEKTTTDDFSASTEPAPVDPYAVSKQEAENAVIAATEDSSMTCTIIRPTLIYGAGVRGNLQRVLALLRRGIPLPLAAVANRRSLLALQNLVDLIVVCLEHENAANQVFLAADDSPISTPQLFHALGQHIGRKPRLFPFPVSLLRVFGTLVGKSAEVDRLCGDLAVDTSHTKRTLGWEPSVTTVEGLRSVVAEPINSASGGNV